MPTIITDTKINIPKLSINLFFIFMIASLYNYAVYKLLCFLYAQEILYPLNIVSKQINQKSIIFLL